MTMDIDMSFSKAAIGLLISASAMALACGVSASEPSADPSPTVSPSTPTPTVQTTTKHTGSTPDTTPVTGAGSPIPQVTATQETTRPALVTFSRDSGEHDAPLHIDLFSDDALSIRYTTDGSDPSAASALTYTGSITLFDSATVRAVGIGADGTASSESSAEYVLIKHQLDRPGIGSEGGAFAEPQTVTLISNEADSAIRYTLDGSLPSVDNGATYTGPLSITKSALLRVVDTRPGMIDSKPAQAQFHIFGRLVERTDDIVLTGDQELVIEDTLFVHTGNITLSGNARLVIRNSYLQHVKEFAFQYGLNANGNSTVVVENSSIGTNCSGSFNWGFFDTASLSADGMDPVHGSCNTWQFMGGTSSIQVANWDTYSGTVCEASMVNVSDSDTLEMEFCFPDGSTIDTSLPTVVDTFSFGPDPDNGIAFALTMQNVTVDGWGINVLPASNITIRDSDAITIGVIAGFPWQNQTVEMDDLARKRYAEKTWIIGPDASLTLINTGVYGWEPNAFSNNTMVIRNSDYTASAVNSGDGHYDISDSTVDLISANERVTMTITNTVITGDVIANDDTVIILIDSEVRGTDHGDDGRSGGNVYARGNGKVILRNTTVIGDTITQDSGEIVVE